MWVSSKKKAGGGKTGVHPRDLWIYRGRYSRAALLILEESVPLSRVKYPDSVDPGEPGCKVSQGLGLVGDLKALERIGLGFEIEDDLDDIVNV